MPSGAPINLQGSVSYTNAAPLTILWKLYSGPASPQFANASVTNTVVTFPIPGTYTLMVDTHPATQPAPTTVA